MTSSVLNVPSLIRTLHALLSSDRVMTDRGAGANLVETVADLARAIDRHAAAIEHANRMREEGR
jgi:hypothetical protein